MFEFLGKTVAKIFGSKSERDLKEIVPYVALINAEYAKLAGLTDDQLRAQTDAVRARIAERLATLDGQIGGLHQQIDTQPQLDIAQKEVLFEQIDALEKQRNKDLEAVLLEVLPVAFAIVKETARRYKENGQLVVTATDIDRTYAATHPNCVIQGDQATWSNTWTAAGDVRVDHTDTARLTTAYLDEAPVSAGAALLFDALETALSLPAGSLAADTIEGSGLAHSFAATAGTTLQFDWRLSTVDFDPAQADRAFVLIDGGLLVSLGTVAASPVSGHFSHTFTSAGTQALAIVLMDVATADRVSTLEVSNLSVSAVPEPGSWALLLAGLAVAGVAGTKRRCRLPGAAARHR